MNHSGKFVIFVSSTQRELAAERRAVKRFVETDALLSRYFSVFLFEDIPASGRQPDEVYLDEVDTCALFIGIFGNDYGFEDLEGVSPTEREFDRASAMDKERLIFVKGSDDRARHSKMAALVTKAGAQLIRRRFVDVPDLISAVYASLVQYLDEHGMLQSRPFDERVHADASLADLDETSLKQFVGMARHERQFALAESATTAEILTHLDLLRDERPTQAAILLFGKTPQRMFPAAEIRCMHFHGTTIQRPAPFYQIFKGNLFSLVEQTVDFVLSKLDYSVGTREKSSQAPGQYEFPPSVIREAVVNAIAHRDYTQSAAIQVSVFSDRIEIRNPGGLLPPLTAEQLHRPHASIARNHHICEALYLARYIEKYGTGTLMMIAETTARALPEPDFEATPGEFVIILWRDWLTTDVITRLGLNDRQTKAISFLKQHGRISNPQYQELTSTTKKTATRDLANLRDRLIVRQIGERGPGVHYEISRKWDIIGTIETSDSKTIQPHQTQTSTDSNSNGDKMGTLGTSPPKKSATRQSP